jgi:ADP-ribose pyrophosphatase YjhB (NUDIX family)
MSDISYNTNQNGFSYRSAGILVHDGRVLLQMHDGEYAFPGGSVAFGETTAETLIREFTEEIGEDIIEVGELKWVWENFYSWNNKPYQQICIYHLLKLKLKEKMRIPLSGKFIHKEYREDDGNAAWFYWIPIDELKNISVHPANAEELLQRIDEGVQHFIFREGAE